jgi:putative membrane protein
VLPLMKQNNDLVLMPVIRQRQALSEHANIRQLVAGNIAALKLAANPDLVNRWYYMRNMVLGHLT